MLKSVGAFFKFSILEGVPYERVRINIGEGRIRTLKFNTLRRDVSLKVISLMKDQEIFIRNMLVPLEFVYIRPSL